MKNIFSGAEGLVRNGVHDDGDIDKTWSPPLRRTAIVHDWLPVYGGAERVLEQMIGVLPDADIYSLLDFLPPDQRTFLAGKRVNTSFIQDLPFARSKYRYYLPLAPLAVEQLEMRDYDVVVSSSYVVAKGVLTTADQLHISYVHSPLRYAWDLYFECMRQERMDRGVRGLISKLVMHYMRLYDQSTADRVDRFVANSRTVARRIRKTYRRDAKVIYPPVDTESFVPNSIKGDFFVTLSRLVPYKRVDLIIDAFSRMPEKELIVIGDGPEFKRLRSVAGPNVTMIGSQPFEAILHYLQHARAFVYAAEEDFGIVNVEAQACATPVIAFGRGGATETVIENRTGVFFHEQNARSLSEAVYRFEEIRPTMSTEEIRLNALRFSKERFRKEFGNYVQSEYQLFRQTDRELSLSLPPVGAASR